MLYQSKLITRLGIQSGVTLSPIEGAVSPKQVHGDKVLRVDRAGSPECDGISTQVKGLTLTIRHADCQAALFYDPANEAIALVHAGWRGNTLNLYQKTVDHMAAEYGTHPADLYLSIGPSLGPENSQFLHYEKEFPESLWRYQWKPFYFDLWKIAHDQAVAAGLRPERIEIAKIDTHADPKYPSYRRDKTGERMVTFASLN